MVGPEAASALCPSGSQCGVFCRTVSGLMASPCTCVLVSGSRLWAWGACESPSELLGPGCRGCRWGWQLSPEASVTRSPGVAAVPRFLGQRPEAPRDEVAHADQLGLVSDPKDRLAGLALSSSIGQSCHASPAGIQAPSRLWLPAALRAIWQVAGWESWGESTLLTWTPSGRVCATSGASWPPGNNGPPPYGP